jgi:hypothetical protein
MEPTARTLERRREVSLLELRAEPGKEGTSTRALRSQGWSKVEKRKVEEKHLEISLPRMPGREQGNLT